MLVFRLMPYLRGMRDMGIDEGGMAEIEAEIVANPTHPMIRGLKLDFGQFRQPPGEPYLAG
jgi:hypothetical protein